MTHSVESRFIAIVSGALLAVVAPLFTLLLALSYQEAIKSQRDHIEILLAANSQALSRPLWDMDDDTINQITGTLVSDPVIRMVRVQDTSGQLDLVQTAGTGVPEEPETVTRSISYKTLNGMETVGSVTIYYASINIFSSLSRIEVAFISIFILAILTVFVTAIVGNRLMIIKPLLRLTAAIEATRQLGSRHHVDWRSSDEMGRLAKSFNEMQIQLEREEREIKKAHKRTTEIYNLTPAMLFSLDKVDRISAVSDYWSQRTGYDRDDIIGKPFADLVDDEDRKTFILRKLSASSAENASDITIRFKCADGKTMDVLIQEKSLTSIEAGRHTASLSVMTDVTELRQSEKRNKHQAISDHLTGLLNRQGFEAMLDEKIREADENRTELACLFIDLDRFKTINDSLGHAAGDEVLQEFVERIKPLLDANDSASRLGGDEFAILLAGENTELRATAFCEKISDIFNLPFSTHGNNVRLSASIGLALYPTHASNAAELLQNSDMAMYSRKRGGKNGAQMFDPSITDKARERAEIESDIEQAIANDWFDAYLQPIVRLESGEIIGFEALMRLNHPTKGILPPAGIINVAEETGTINRIGNLILEHSLANLAEITNIPHLSDCYVAVNFSAQQFEPGLPTRIAGLLYRYNIQASRLVIEITEAVLMNDDPQIRTILNTIHDFGCRIALDDFGTGYSSLSYLNRFPVDIVKIDQSFTKSIMDPEADISQKSHMLVEGISTISHKMNCSVIAEGIETREQQELLMAIGVDCGQGYLFARPQPMTSLMPMFTAQTAAMIPTIGAGV
ncbi:EAL domain-containing protein [Agrobacterium sp.]|jgi:diguanylate cyclase (GGDEF)-like protein/PAS domain S-box-containing protein|uniref:EAL domain-containing protein n=1 Tax=Agrobacterium sp. TaxID=361 RepID=UPI0028A6209E|nr:EAL domain-containing protein [Agrobacterium sp.]